MVVVAYFSIVIERPGIVGPASSVAVSMVVMIVVSSAITWFKLVVVMVCIATRMVRSRVISARRHVCSHYAIISTDIKTITKNY